MSTDPQPMRREYTPPALRVFGDLAQLTRSVGRTSLTPDGATGGR